MASCVLCASLLQVNRSETRFTTRDDAQSHAALHLSQLKHFDGETCSSLDQVFDQCFPNFNITPARKQKRIVVKKEGRQTLLNVCQSVFNGRITKDSPRMTCQKCGSRIILYSGKEGGLHFAIAINHASAHLKIDLFECRECGRSFSNKHALCAHLRVTHRLKCLSEYFTDKSGDFVDEIFNSVQQCFAEGNTNVPADEKARMIRRQSLLNVCHTIFKGRITKDLPRVTCQKCRSGIILYGGQNAGLQFGVAIDHASAHLGIDLFECRECGRSFAGRNALRKHLRVTHGLRCLSEYFTDKSGDYINEIISSIEHCFTEGNKNGQTEEKAREISRLREEASVRSNTKGSKLAVERQLCCHRLIRQLAGDDGKIRCRLCPKRIYFKQGGGFRCIRPMEHALFHLKKPLFLCKVCSSVHHTYGSLRSHLKSEHVLPLMNNYVDLTDDFHADVMNMLQKCYAEKPSN